jgi:hypothetical protein
MAPKCGMRVRTNAEGRIYVGVDYSTLRIAIDIYEQKLKEMSDLAK